MNDLPIEKVLVVEREPRKDVNSKFWHDPMRLELLGQLLHGSDSYATIADKLNRQWNTNFSRNAICGAIDRAVRRGDIVRPVRKFVVSKVAQSSPRRVDQHTRDKIKRIAIVRGRTEQGDTTRYKPVALYEIKDNPDDFKTPQARRVTDIMRLNDKHCRWPVGEPGKPGFFWCGAKTTVLSYCTHHYDRSVDWVRTARIRR